MRIFLISIFLLLGATKSLAVECSDYLSQAYSGAYKEKVTITSSLKYVDKYEGYIGAQPISSVVYGKGYMKRLSGKKIKVSIICLFENSDKPIWGYVIPR